MNSYFSPCRPKKSIAQVSDAKEDEGEKLAMKGNSGQFLSLSMINSLIQEQKSQLVEIEYLVINMPRLLTEKPKLFMEIVQKESSRDLSYLQNPLIQHVINFKWNQYTRSFFILEFSKFALFILAFILDVIFISPDGFDQSSDEARKANIAVRVVCGLLTLDNIRYELKQIWLLGLRLYLVSDVWNLFDMLHSAAYVAYLPIIFLYSPDYYAVKALQCSIILLVLVKLNFFLRIFDDLGFMVQMVTAVFRDLQHFLVYFAILLSVFAVQVSVLMRDVQGHEGIGPVQFFVMTLRTSLGDNDLDQEYTEFKILFWIVWVLIMLVGNIVMMNFIIAVVSDSYSQCMTTRVAQSFKVKVDMIIERELIMTDRQLANT